jgi:predicted dehydrogenase
MADPLRVGVLGCGAIAQAIHVPLLRRTPGATLVAVADPSPAARAAAVRLAPGVDVFEDLPSLLRSGRVGAVVVCAPSALHGPLALAVLEAGMHLYLEKPLAVDRESAERAAAAASASSVVATIGFNRRFHPAFLALRRSLTQGGAGELRELRTRFCEPVARSMPDWKRRRETGGGALLDLASHHVDLVRFVAGEEVEVELASIRSVASEHDEAELVLRLASGVRATIEVSFHGPRADVVEARCAARTLRADRHAGLRARLRPGWDPSYRTSLRAFVDRVRGASLSLPTLEDGLRSLEVVLAAERAAA